MSDMVTASYPRELQTIRTALYGAPDRCRYHGTDFGFLGWQWGEPQCESCLQPWRITQARAALDRIVPPQHRANIPEVPAGEDRYA